MRVHHIGYLVPDMEKASREFCAMGYETVTDVFYDSVRGIHISFVRNGHCLVELIVPDEDCPSIGKKLRSLRCAPYHICYECDDIEHASAELSGRGYLPLSEAEPAPVFGGGTNVRFFFGNSIGLIEIVERGEGAWI